MRPRGIKQWIPAQNLDVDVATSPEVVDTFIASCAGGPPIAGGVTWLWSAFCRDDSTTNYNHGNIQLTWNGALATTVSSERARAEVPPVVTFTCTVAAGIGSTVVVTLLATTLVNNYVVKTWRSPYTTMAVTV